MKRLICSLLAALLAVFVLCSGAMAEGELCLQDVRVGDQTLRLIVKSSDTSFLQASGFQVMLDQQVTQPTELLPMERSGMTTDHIYVVDVSSLSNSKANRIADMQATLGKLIDNLPSGDQAAVVTTGMTASNISLTNNKAALRAVADSLQFDSKLNALDAALREVCTFLSEGERTGARAEIVVLSSGENETMTSAALAELSDKINRSRATVYTIAYKKYDPQESSLSGYSLLALQSQGGISLEADYVPQNKPASDSVISGLVSKIKDNEAMFFVLNVPLSQGMISFSDVTIQYELNGQLAADKLTLTSDQRDAVIAELAKLQPEPTDPPTPPDPTPEPTIIDRVLDFVQANKVAAIGGAVILVLVIVLLVVLLSGKKKEPTSEDVGPMSGEDEGKTIIEDGPADYDKTQPVSDTLVTLTPVSQGDVVVRNVPAPITDSLQIGRRDDQCQIVISARAGDADIRTVSRVHARLTKRGDTMLLENLSQNGTKINNVKIERPSVLQVNDIITLGSVSFRISWR